MKSPIVVDICGVPSLHCKRADGDPNKVLRYAFRNRGTTFDPLKATDVYSSIVNKGMFDTPVRYDHPGAPVEAGAQPAGGDAGSLNGLPRTMKVKPGILLCR